MHTPSMYLTLMGSNLMAALSNLANDFEIWKCGKRCGRKTNSEYRTMRQFLCGNCVKALTVAAVAIIPEAQGDVNKLLKT